MRTALGLCLLALSALTGLALAQDGRFVRDDRTRLTPPTL